MIPVRDGDRQAVGCESEPKLFRIAAVGDCLAQQLAILHDIDEIAQTDCDTGDRDVGPVGIRAQCRPNFIDRRTQRIGFLSIAAARFEPSRCPGADCGNARRRLIV